MAGNIDQLPEANHTTTTGRTAHTRHTDPYRHGTSNRSHEPNRPRGDDGNGGVGWGGRGKGGGGVGRGGGGRGQTQRSRAYRAITYRTPHYIPGGTYALHPDHEPYRHQGVGEEGEGGTQITIVPTVPNHPGGGEGRFARLVLRCTVVIYLRVVNVLFAFNRFKRLVFRWFRLFYLRVVNFLFLFSIF